MTFFDLNDLLHKLHLEFHPDFAIKSVTMHVDQHHRDIIVAPLTLSEGAAIFGLFEKARHLSFDPVSSS